MKMQNVLFKHTVLHATFRYYRTRDVQLYICLRNWFSISSRYQYWYVQFVSRFNTSFWYSVVRSVVFLKLNER